MYCSTSVFRTSAKPPAYSYHNSPLKYNPAGHVITTDLNIIDNENIGKIIAKGSKYRDWKYNFTQLTDYVEDYA